MNTNKHNYKIGDEVLVRGRITALDSFSTKLPYQAKMPGQNYFWFGDNDIASIKQPLNWQKITKDCLSEKVGLIWAYSIQGDVAILKITKEKNNLYNSNYTHFAYPTPDYPIPEPPREKVSYDEWFKSYRYVTEYGAVRDLLEAIRNNKIEGFSCTEKGEKE